MLILTSDYLIFIFHPAESGNSVTNTIARQLWHQMHHVIFTRRSHVSTDSCMKLWWDLSLNTYVCLPTLLLKLNSHTVNISLRIQSQHLYQFQHYPNSSSYLCLPGYLGVYGPLLVDSLITLDCKGTKTIEVQNNPSCAECNISRSEIKSLLHQYFITIWQLTTPKTEVWSGLSENICSVTKNNYFCYFLV